MVLETKLIESCGLVEVKVYFLSEPALAAKEPKFDSKLQFRIAVFKVTYTGYELNIG